MSEPTKQQIGDGKDDYGRAASQATKAAKQVYQGVKATGNAAAQTVNAGAKVGKAVADIAKGTAAGGPWGAVISAAWSLRHTLFKVLVAIGLAIVLLIVAIFSLPSIIFGTIFNRGYSPIDGKSTLVMAFEDLSNLVGSIIQSSFNTTLGRVGTLISVGGYDYSYSMNHLIYRNPMASDYDMYYILSAYSVSEFQKEVTPDGLKEKLNSVTELMFPISYVVKNAQRWVQTLTGLLLQPFQYIVCTIAPFDNSSILKAFDINLNAQYGEFSITYGEAIEYMATSLEMTMNGGA